MLIMQYVLAFTNSMSSYGYMAFYVAIKVSLEEGIICSF